MPERDPSLPELPVGAATPDTVRGSWGTGEGTALDHVVRWAGGGAAAAVGAGRRRRRWRRW